MKQKKIFVGHLYWVISYLLLTLLGGIAIIYLTINNDSYLYLLGLMILPVTLSLSYARWGILELDESGMTFYKFGKVARVNYTEIHEVLFTTITDTDHRTITSRGFYFITARADEIPYVGSFNIKRKMPIKIKKTRRNEKILLEFLNHYRPDLEITNYMGEQM